MTEARRVKSLRIVLVLVALAFFSLYPLTVLWPSGWAWHSGAQSLYLEMIFGVYATLGIFLIVASRNPLAHKSLIWFTIWSSVAHSAIMGAQAIAIPAHISHLWGDVPALLIIAAALAFLMPRAGRPTAQARVA
jgi:hypothetical protein